MTMQGVDASRRRLGMTICLDFNSGTESTDHSSEESNGPDDGDALDTMNASLQAMALSLSDVGVLDTSVSDSH